MKRHFEHYWFVKRVFTIALVLSLFLFPISSIAGAADLLTYSEPVNGSIMTLATDKVSVVELESNPSTGYTYVVKGLDKNVANYVGSTFEPESDLLGAPGIQKLYFKGVSQGKSKVKFVYKRPWKKNFEKSFMMTIHSNGKYKGKFTLQKENIESKKAASPEDISPLWLPTSFSWCNQGGCTPVKNQGSCGSCWAFGSTVPFESLIKIKDGETVDLAEQYLVSCNNDGWGCNGGFTALEYYYNKKVSGEDEAGGVLEEDFPYQASDVPCNGPHSKIAKLDGWDYVDSSSVSDIKAAVYEHGPVSCAVCAGSSLSNYSGGVIHSGCTGLNHLVAIVGWDDSNNCWIVKNSWGSGWGENGYFRIEYGVSGIGSEAAYADYSGSGPNPPPTPDNYCEAKGGSQYYEYIKKVGIGSFSKSSGSAGYSDFTSEIINAEPGQSYTANLTPGFTGSSYTEHWRIWIDFNGDGDFEDANEKVFEGSGSSIVTGAINIPQTAETKDTRMRVAMGYGSYPDTCGDFTYGEVEDYTISISGGPVPPPNNYCEAKGGSQHYEYIKKVRIGSFSKSSGSAGYSDFTSEIINAEQGQSYTANLTPGFTGSSYTERWRMWIDLNRDGDFEDANEKVFQGSGRSTVTGAINIPASAAAGQTRLRVSMAYGNYPEPCGDYSYGEVEDYTIDISTR